MEKNLETLIFIYKTKGKKTWDTVKTSVLKGYREWLPTNITGKTTQHHSTKLHCIKKISQKCIFSN